MTTKEVFTNLDNGCNVRWYRKAHSILRMPGGIGKALHRKVSINRRQDWVNKTRHLEAGINSLPGFAAVVRCSYSPGLRNGAVSNSSESTFDAFYIDAHASFTDHQRPVFTLVGRPYYTTLAGSQEYTV